MIDDAIKLDMNVSGVPWCFAEYLIYLRPLASLSTAAPGSTARASNSCTSSRRDFLTVRRVLRRRREISSSDPTEESLSVLLRRHKVIHNTKCA